jgi:hypothetical protein
MSARAESFPLAAPRALRWFPSVADIVLLLPVLFLLLTPVGLSGLLGDGDTGWHLRAGEWMLDHRAVPRTDLFSFTKPGQPWYAWEWGWDLAFGALHRAWGMEAVVWFSLLLISAMLYLVYREALLLSGNLLLAFAVAFVVANGSAIHWLARPHLVSLLFLAASVILLRRGAAWWVYPLLTLAWVNLHGAFFVLWTLLAAYTAEALLLRSWTAARSYGLALAACIAASFVNPYGWQLHAHIFGYFSDNYHFQHIQEFQSIDFHAPPARFFLLAVLFSGAAGLWHLQRKRFAAALILMAWAALALIAARNIPVFLIVAAPWFALAAGEMLAAVPGLRAVKVYLAGMTRLELGLRVPVLGLCGLVLLGALMGPDAPAKLRAEYRAERYPVRALDAVRQLPAEARVFSDDEWGDFLIYRLWPERKVFIDGRSDFYGSAFGKETLRASQPAYDWQKILDRYRIDAVLWRVEEPLATTLKESRRWRIVHDDGVALLAVRDKGTTNQLSEETNQ